MATQALAQLNQLKQQTLAEEYGGKESNKFVNDLKASTLFQTNWGELLSAAPTALSLMGSLWVAASDPAAEQISLKSSVPTYGTTKGFKYIPNRQNPDLRSTLVDVCNNGGKLAFKTAGKNMETIGIRSRKICEENIPIVFKRLPTVTKGPEELEEFNDALTDFATDARYCAKLATETRQAFTNWGFMVGELQAATEHQKSQNSTEREETKVEENMAIIEKQFANTAVTTAKENVATMKTRLDKAEKRLDTALDKVPGPWATVAMGAVTGFTQALPHILAGALPMMMASKSAGALAGGAGVPASSGTATATTQQGISVAQKANDPAYSSAGELRDLVNNFYEFLGGDTRQIDWTKFEEAKEKDSNAKPSGISYLLATLSGHKKNVDETGTSPNKQLRETIEKLITVVNDISNTRKGQTDLTSAKVPEATTSGWKTTVKQARSDILQLSSSAPMQTGGVPNVMGKIDVPKVDLSAQTAQLSTAMQGVQLAQATVDLAQDSYDAAIKKQGETARAMADVEKRLKSLIDKGQTLDEIKKVLNQCITVLVDLVIQIGRIEDFFTMLTTVIDNYVTPQVERFTRDMGRVGKTAAAKGYINEDDLTKQIIYTYTLQLKAYFSLLEDISVMYSNVHRTYIGPGIELCDQLSKGSASKVPMDQLSQQLANYSHESAEKVAELVSKRKEEVLNGLKDRAKKAMENVRLIEDAVAANGLTVDNSAKTAIREGGAEARQEAQKMIDSSQSATVLADFNDA